MMEYRITSSDVNTKISFVDIICVASLLFYAIGNFEDSLLRIAIWGLLPFSSLLIFFKKPILCANVYMKYLAALFLWSGFTAIFAYDTEVALNSMTRMAFVFLFCYILVYLARSYATIYLVCLVYLVFFINCIVYAQTHILSVIDTIGDGFRLQDEKLNANLFAYFLFITTFIIYYLGFVSKNKKTRQIWRLLFFLLIPLSFYIAILTASRQVLIIQIPYFAILLYKRYWKQSKPSVKFVSISILVFAVLYLSNDVISMYNSSNLATRSQVSVGNDSRALLAKEAFEIGLDNILLGVGPDNFKVFSFEKNFSHNTYLELFANSGIIAAIIYIAMIYTFLRSCFYKWKKSHSNEIFCLLLFGVFFAIDNIFYVFHLNAWLMGIFIFVASIGMNKSK